MAYKYRLCAFSPGVKWLQDREGVFWVNPVYFGEFILHLYSLEKK